MALDTNLVSYWKFDENAGATTAEDVYAINNLTKDGSATFAAGKINNGTDLEGGNNGDAWYILDGDQTGLDLNSDFTFSFWFKPESLPGGYGYCLLGKYSSSGNNRSYVLTIYDNAGSDTFSLMISPNGTTTGATVQEKVIDISAGTWYYFTITYILATGTAEFFLNGSSQGTVGSGATSIYNGTASFTIGYFLSPVTFPYDGMIDEFGVWNRVLDSDEVTALYNEGRGLSYPFTQLISPFPSHYNT